jgi:type II restriction enzyme
MLRIGVPDMEHIASKAIHAVNNGLMAYCKFLSANDTGVTGGHQAGIYIAKTAIQILFDTPGIRGENKDRFVKILWQGDFVTESRFIYYGTGTRNEYRITRFGRSFPFLSTEHTGDLFVFVKNDVENYSAYVLSTEDEIDTFLDTFALSPTDTGSIIQKEDLCLDSQVEIAFDNFIKTLDVDFPISAVMSAEARKIYTGIFNQEDMIVRNPDNQIISWIDMEYRLFRRIELSRYGDIITKGFTSVEQFIDVANMVLNRRKSRAGRSLEHHLSAVFDGNALVYQSQPRTEGNKKPDFLFPGETVYHDLSYPSEHLIFLAAKTTCKDRWRQILNEANRVPEKHLFTLQQGISVQQLNEMEAERVTLVVPAPYIKTYPQEKRPSIWTLRKFIAFVKERAKMEI